MDPIIIVGSGLAGYAVARELRKLDTATPLLIITGDAGDAYSKPMLSNALTAGKSAASLASANPEKLAQDLNAQILTHTTVNSIDAAVKTLATDKGSHRYHALVLALGAEPIRPQLEGDAADALLPVNDLWDYAHFRQRLEGAKKIAILGAGLIGCEFANDLAGKGYDISVVGLSQQPLANLIPEAAGAVLAERLQELGVQWKLGRRALGAWHRDGQIELRLDNGETMTADVVLSAVGLRPRTQLASAAGIAVRHGIQVDAMLRTSAPDVYALGDCAEIEGQVMLYVPPIMHASRALAKTLSGEPTAAAFPPMPVAIKTTAYPITVLPPPAGSNGEWELLEQDGGLKLAFHDASRRLLGFALTSGKTSQRTALLAQLGNAS